MNLHELLHRTTEDDKSAASSRNYNQCSYHSTNGSTLSLQTMYSPCNVEGDIDGSSNRFPQVKMIPFSPPMLNATPTTLPPWKYDDINNNMPFLSTLSENESSQSTSNNGNNVPGSPQQQQQHNQQQQQRQWKFVSNNNIAHSTTSPLSSPIPADRPPHHPDHPPSLPPPHNPSSSSPLLRHDRVLSDATPSDSSHRPPPPLSPTTHHHHHHHPPPSHDHNHSQSHHPETHENAEDDNTLLTKKWRPVLAAAGYPEGTKQPVLTINGDNVTSDNIEEGYIQFMLHHDFPHMADSLENLMCAKRKFTSVPKTGELKYSTWDVFVLVRKLHNQEIKNWSQLVGHLGLPDSGRPQFAQRVKRWMHKYKIDCYFDYLLGNPYDFHAPDEKYSGCLMMGNYQKRKVKDDDSVRSAEESRKRKRTATVNNNDEDADGEGSDSDEDKRKRRAPVLLAGSRKRAKGSILHFDSNQHTEEEEEDAANVNNVSEDGDDDHEQQRQQQEEYEEEYDEDEDEQQRQRTVERAQKVPSARSKKMRSMIADENDDDNEEDELASSSSSGAPSPILSTRPIDSSNTATTIPAAATQPYATSTSGICGNCTQLKEIITSMQREMRELQDKVNALEVRLKEDSSSKEQESEQHQRISRLEAIFEHYEKSRSVLADLFAQKPAEVLR